MSIDIFSFAEIYHQTFADAQRIIDLGLQEHDAEVVGEGYKKLADVLGAQAAEQAVLDLISARIGSGEFSFVDEQTGEVSPLL